MTVYLAFNEHLDQPGLGVNAALVVATGITRAHVRSGFRITGANDFDVPMDSAISEGWASVYWGHPTATTSYSTSRDNFSLKSAGGVIPLALRITAQGTYPTVSVVNYANSTTTALWTGPSAKIDINFKIHASTGFFYVYVDGVLAYSFTGNTVVSGATSVSTIRIGGQNTSVSTAQVTWSEILVSDVPTIGSKVRSRAFSAAGAVNQFGGAVSDLSAANSPDTSYMTENTPNDILTMTSAAISALSSGEFISAVLMKFRANYEPGAAVTKLAPVARQGGTNYIASPISISNTVDEYSTMWATDPATGIAWTEAGVNAVELGFQAQS